MRAEHFVLEDKACDVTPKDLLIIVTYVYYSFSRYNMLLWILIFNRPECWIRFVLLVILIAFFLSCCRFICFPSAMRPTTMWPSLPRDHPLNKLLPPATTCTEQSTQWSACSQSCGAGISTRVSNQNLACKLQMETRLCKVRPCRSVQRAPRKPMVS